MTAVSQSALKEIIDKHECVVNGVVQTLPMRRSAVALRRYGVAGLKRPGFWTESFS